MTLSLDIWLVIAKMFITECVLDVKFYIIKVTPKLWKWKVKETQIKGKHVFHQGAEQS